MKKALMAASLVLIAGTFVGCGGGDGGSAPDAASEADFCAAFEQVAKDTSGSSDQSTQDQISAAKDAVGKLVDVGTPKGIPDDARAGFELLIDTIKGVDDNASDKDLTAIFDNFSADQQKEFLAFSTYIGTTCPNLGASPSS